MARGYAPGKSVPRRYPKKDLPILRAAARKYGIPARILAAQEFVESGYADDVTAGTRRSSTGAFGRSQFMPGTAATYHVRPGLSKSAIKSQVFGHAHYLHDLGASKDLRRAIASYAGGPGNPQYGYAQTVLSLSKSYRGVGKGKALGGAQRRSGGVSGGSVTKIKTVKPPPFQPATGLADLLAAQTQHVMTPVGASAPQEPTFSARAHLALPKGYAGAPSTNAPPSFVKPSVATDIRAIEDAANTQPVARPAVTTKSVTKLPGQKGKVTITKRGTPKTTQLKGVSKFEGKPVAAWIKPWLVYARKHGWKGTVSSGYRSYADQARIYASGVRPAARPGTSNHEGANFPRGAIDVTDQYTLDRILRRARSPLKFAGSKDPVHFSHPHNGGY